jgi:hypothetical protein
MSKRGFKPRLTDRKIVHLRKFDKAAETSALFGVMVVMDLGEAVIEKGI